jgi:hypothetical protein
VDVDKLLESTACSPGRVGSLEEVIELASRR